MIHRGVDDEESTVDTSDSLLEHVKSTHTHVQRGRHFFPFICIGFSCRERESKFTLAESANRIACARSQALPTLMLPFSRGIRCTYRDNLEMRLCIGNGCNFASPRTLSSWESALLMSSFVGKFSTISLYLNFRER